jgi:alkanesulfonate monooxygenase SsuD/methylene tetrahydromethanopterin reductase-like flavin-dependent oxidoreductase (luciferase family)
MPTLCVKYECRAPAGLCTMTMAELYDTALEQIAWIDAQGHPVTINFCEHHGSEDAYLPSPFVLAAAAARVTKHVRLQVNVLVPFSDPLRVAEDAAVLDQLSKGRAELLLLGGYVASELEMFGVDPKSRGLRMEEAVATLRAAWSGEAFTFRGRRARVTPVPYQRGGPRLFMGGSSPAAARRAAREGGIFIAGIPQLNEVYVAECARLGRTPHYQKDMPFSFLFVSEDPDRDWTLLAPYCLYETNCYARWQSTTGLDMLFNEVTDAAALRAYGTYQVVRPESVIAAAPAMAPNDALVLHPLISGLDRELSWSTLRTFFDRVAPRVGLNWI